MRVRHHPGHVIKLPGVIVFAKHFSDSKWCKQLLALCAARVLARDQWFVCVPTHEGANKRM
jgi:hypothetical protein